MAQVMALDLGTTGIKVSVFDEKGHALASEYREYPTYYPHNNWVEQDPDDWWFSFCEASREVLGRPGVDRKEIVGVAPSGQMSTAIPIDRDGNVLMKPVFIWADMRASEQVKDVVGKLGGYDRFYDITAAGLATETYSAFKVAWLRDNSPSILDKTYKFLQVKDYIAFRLTGEIATDFSDASDSGLLDYKKRQWSEEILNLIGLAKDKLPPIKKATEITGRVTEEAAAETGLVPGTPVVVGGGDVSIAAAGAGVVKEGMCYIYIGSATWTGVYSSKPVSDLSSRMLGLCSVSDDHGYVPHHIVFGGGICYQWVRDLIKVSGFSGKDLPYKFMDERAKETPIGSDGLLFLPYMRGGGAPHHNPNARGALVGLGLSQSYGHLCRAVMEGVAFGLREMIEIFISQGAAINEVRMIGGGARSFLWRQIVADITKKTVTSTNMTQEANSWGAALCAGVGVGLWPDFSVTEQLVRATGATEPRSETTKIYDTMFQGFKDTYKSLVPTFDCLAQCREE